MQWRDSTNKSTIKLNTAEIKFDTDDLFMNGENYQGKNPTGGFEGHHSPKSTIINHKRLQV